MIGLSLVFIWSLKLQNSRKKKIKKSDDNTLKTPKTGVFVNNRIICKCRYTLLKEIIILYIANRTSELVSEVFCVKKAGRIQSACFFHIFSPFVFMTSENQ